MTTEKLQIVDYLADIAARAVEVCTRAVSHAGNLGDTKHQEKYSGLVKKLLSIKTPQELADQIRNLIVLINDLDFLQAHMREPYRAQLTCLLNKAEAVHADIGDNVVVGAFKKTA